MGYYNRHIGVLAGGLDPDATAFIIAAGITDATQQSAINTLVKALKNPANGSLWTKCFAIYPFVGGTAASHKFNLKDPRDLDAAYRLVFGGSWTHSSTGALPNGVNASADTRLNALSVLTLYNVSLSYYSRTQALQAGQIDMGAVEAPSGTRLLSLILPRASGSAFATHTGQTNATDMAVASGQTLTTGFFINNRASSTPSSLRLIKNGVLLASATTNTGTYVMPNSNISIGQVSGLYTNKETAFNHIGLSLTVAEETSLTNIVQAFQTTLSRQV